MPDIIKIIVDDIAMQSPRWRVVYLVAIALVLLMVLTLIAVVATPT
jgi:hypothetical protein